MSRYPYVFPPYNGFSHEERMASIPVQNAAAKTGQFRFPTACSICSFSDAARPRGAGYIYAHLEDYRQPLSCHPTCRYCHAALHVRFREPERWQGVLAKHHRAGAWFTLLTSDPASQTVPFDLTYPEGLPATDRW